MTIDQKNEEAQFLRIMGCSVEKKGILISHEAGHMSLPWDSITHAFAVFFEKRNLHKVPLFLLLTRDTHQYIYIDGSNIATMKLVFDGSIYLRLLASKMLAHRKSSDSIDAEFVDIVSKICAKFSWTHIDRPLRELIKGENHNLPTFTNIEEMRDYCEKIAGVSGTTDSEVSVTDNTMKEIQTLTGPLVTREEWKVGSVKENRYVIDSILKGGMGIVYVALDNTRGYYYAIKTFQDKYLWEETVIAQFIREAEIWVNLEKHKNIVQAEMVKIIDGKPYIFLEYVRGKDLETVLKDGLLPLEKTIDYAIQFCNGMNYAFQRLGLVHRDIKPSNCFITRESVLKISDFGLGKVVLESKDHRDGRMSLMESGDLLSSASMVGTLPFMAPELFSDMQSAGVKTDIYAFGVMLYIMLTGVNPFFDEDPTEVIDRHLSLIPEDPVLLYPQIPSELKIIVFKCLEKETSDRYDDFGLIKDDLEKIYLSFTGKPYEYKGEEDVFTEEDWIKKGVSLASLGRHIEAIFTFDEAIKLNPRSPAKLHKGISLSVLGNYKGSLRCFDEMLSLFPDTWKIWYHKGDTHRLQGYYDEALACYNKALTLTSQKAPIIGGIGKVMEEQGNYQEALEYYDQALAHNEKMAEVWDYKGCLLMQMNKFDSAQECFTEATEINPRFQEAWFHRGIALYELGFFNESIKAHSLSLSLQCEFVPSLLGLGDCYRELKDFNRSIDFYNKALLLQPVSLPVQLAKLRLLIEDKHYEDALEYINEILKKEPDNPQLILELVQTFYELGMYDDSLQLAQELVKKEKGNWRLSLLIKSAKNWIREERRLMEDILDCTPLREEEVFSNINTLLCVTCDVEYALSLLAHYVKRSGKSDAKVIQALLYSAIGRHEEAYAAIENASAAHPVPPPEVEKLMADIVKVMSGHGVDRGESKSALEWMLQGLGKLNDRLYDEALRAFQKALNKDASLHSVWFFAGLAFENLGRNDDYRRYLNNFIQYFPHSPGFYREMIMRGADVFSPEEIELAYKKWIGFLPSDHRSWLAYLRFLIRYGYTEKAHLVANKVVSTYIDDWLIPSDSDEFVMIYGLLQLFMKRFKSAEQTFSDILKNRPEHFAAKIAMGKALELSGKLYDAERIYQECTNNEDVSLMACYQLSGLYGRMQQYEKALAAINEAISKRANISELMFRKAECLLWLKDFAECLEVCYKIITTDKSLIAGYVLHCVALQEKSRSSVDFISRGISAHPRNVTLLKTLALSYLDMHDYFKAVAACDLLISWNKIDVDAVIAQGIAHYKTCNFQKAIASFQNAAEIDFRNPDIWLFLGATHFHLKNEKIAETFFRQALLVKNSYAPALVNLGIYLYEQGRLVEAQQWSEKALRINAEYGPAWLARARCCRIYGNTEDARKSIESAIIYMPEELKAWVLRGIIECENSEANLSLQSFKKASEIAPEEPVVWYNLGYVAFIDDKLEHAFKWGSQALTLEPDLFEALVLKALCLEKMQKKQKAEELLQYAYKTNPEKFMKWKKLQSMSTSSVASLKLLELRDDPFFLPAAPAIEVPDPVNAFHLEKPEEVLGLVKDLSEKRFH